MLRRTFIAVLLLLTLLLTPFSAAFAATYFWVGGTGSFSQTAHWSLSSGGTSGVGPPGATDTAIWDSNSGGGTYTINGSPTVLVFQYTNINKADALQFSGNLTISALGTLSIQGVSVTNRGYLNSSTLGTSRSIFAPSGATVTVTNCDLQDINMAGTFTTGATASSIGDALGNTFGWSSVQPDAGQTGVNALVMSSTGTVNWSAATWTNGSVTRVPLPQDDVTINYAGASATTLTEDMPRLGRNIDFTGYTKAVTTSLTTSIFGSLTLSSTMSGQLGNAVTFYGRGSHTVTFGGNTGTNYSLEAFGGTYTQQNNFFCNSLVVSNGVWNANNFNYTGVSFDAGTSGATARSVLRGSGIWTISGTSGNIWRSSGAALTMPAAGETINLTGAISTSATFGGGGFTFNNLNWSSTTSTGTLIITGANTFAKLQAANNNARTIQFQNGVTQQILPNGWNINGRQGNVISITSDSAGNAATIRTGSSVKAKYLSIKDSAATGGPWCAANSNNVSGNSGWMFGTCSTTTKRAGRILSTQ